MDPESATGVNDPDDRDLARAMHELERPTERLRGRNAELEQFASATPTSPPPYADPAVAWWCITVRDNGRGFAPEDVDRLFVAFDRLGQADVPGTGVGLPICKRVVERHGGEISAEGTPGQGATFTILLPERPPAP